MLDLDTVHELEAREGLRRLPADSVDCVLTSPAYWAQRDYGVAPSTWSDGWVGALGLEPDFDLYLNHLLEVFDEVKRVLKPTGTLWVNIGDCYAGPWCIEAPRPGAPGAADVVGTRDSDTVAIEVETGKADAVANVRHGLQAGFGRIVVAATDRAALTAVETALARAGLLIPPRVEVVLAWAPGPASAPPTG